MLVVNLLDQEADTEDSGPEVKFERITRRNIKASKHKNIIAYNTTL